MENKEIFTSVVRIKGDPNNKVVSVKSTEPVDISIWKELSKVIGRIYVSTPIKVGDLICKNIMNTGVDIVCTKTIEI
ncbi:MAG: DUF1667 domain-containing protein [Clostridium sp.]|uniref:DUF1667 domain-containing protein n=1 Tax=Clostridium TaxID=1485 RepID=UPI00188435B1|nr:MULTISPECIES: DUF1667 domain-containing protein [Clostridium]MCR6514875.1 DUF1667 domain-containing protein [Clostridium sp. LY3-2]